MKINPKLIAGIILLIVLVVITGLLAVRVSHTASLVAVEKSLTPTPLPPYGNVRAVTVDPYAPTPEPVLRSGSTGQAVTDLQYRLSALGYYTGMIDGQFGPGTRDAVALFQKSNGLPADGIVGSETKALLFSDSAKAYAPPDETPVP